MKVLLLTLALAAVAAATPLEYDDDGVIHFDTQDYPTVELDGEEHMFEYIDGEIHFDTQDHPTVELDGEEHMFENIDGEIHFDTQDHPTVELDSEEHMFEFIDGEIRLDTQDHPTEESPEWSLVPDGDGHFHYVDAKTYQNEPEVEPFFNAANDIIFRVFTRRNPTAGQVITFNNLASLTNSQYNSAHPTRFIIHGWNNNGGSQVNTAIRNAYINRGEFNVIVIDWGAGAQTANYVAARNRVNDVGAIAGRMIDWMNQFGGLAFNRISVIGHSLGGHAAGITGKRVARGRLHSVIALDPALPLFAMNQPAQRVAPTDAEYVEVMHTNAGLLGFDQPIGIADFYPNWGRTQPGCGIDLAGSCAHSRAHEFFAESINLARRFVSTQCASYAQILNSQCTSSGPTRLMGAEPSQHNLARGIYFVATNGASPFARG